MIKAILSNEDSHKPLVATYDELMALPGPIVTIVTTRLQARGEPPTVHTSTSTYHQSLSPRTI